MCYIELGTMIHESGGNYTYLDKAYGDGFAFLYSWISILLLRPSSLSIIALTCGEYLIAPFFGDGCGRGPDGIIKMVAIMVICESYFLSYNLLNVHNIMGGMASISNVVTIIWHVEASLNIVSFRQNTSILTPPTWRLRHGLPPHYALQAQNVR